MREIYEWVPWFQELAEKIDEGGEAFLAEAAKKVAWRGDDRKQPLLEYGDENIDPFSFFYTLAQRSQGAGSRDRVFRSIKEVFNMESDRPIEAEDGFVYPTPSYNALFHDGHQGNPKLLWNLFRKAVRGRDSVDTKDFDSALKIRKVGPVNLTQALFLVNPFQFLPCDEKMDRIVRPPTGEFNWMRYQEWLETALGLFPGCEPLEVNLFAYLSWSDSLPVRSDRCFQVSTNVYDDGDDYWIDFSDNNWVYTGGPASGIGWEEYDESRHGHRKYPLEDPERGDVILVRTGRSQGRGMGIVSRNDYRDQLAADSRIHVIWLNKVGGKLSGYTQIKGFNHARNKTLNIFRQAREYTETFALLDRLGLREPVTTEEEAQKPEQKPKVEHPMNQILYGPPGTGKTFHAVDHALAIIDGANVRERKDDDIERFHELRDSGQVAMVTFHQNYAYEDFIEGIRPKLSKGVSGQVGYVLHPGVFKRMVKAANEEVDKPFVLIIDEINRGNIAKIFGELITLIEGSRRIGAKDATTVTLPYSKELLGVPGNLYLVGTMNTADRSIQLLDTALRRRFSFVEMMPKYENISNDVEGVDCQAMLRTMNRRITALLDREHQIGHTYLLEVTKIKELSVKFQNEIFPLLQEYFFDDWSKIRAVLGGNDFVVVEGTAGLFRGTEQEVEEQVYQRLPDNRKEWTEPDQYRRIYETPAQQSR